MHLDPGTRVEQPPPADTEKKALTRRQRYAMEGCLVEGGQKQTWLAFNRHSMLDYVSQRIHRKASTALQSAVKQKTQRHIYRQNLKSLNEEVLPDPT